MHMLDMDVVLANTNDARVVDDADDSDDAEEVGYSAAESTTGAVKTSCLCS